MFRFLFLQSVGGTLEGANRIIDIIKANNIEVAIPPHSFCYSACVKVLLETTHRGSSFLGSQAFLIGIHQAHDGNSLLGRYILPYIGERTYDPRMMRGWIVEHSAAVAVFLDQCPSSPYDDLEMFVLTSHQYQEISRGLNDYNCADIWHQHKGWADELLEKWWSMEAN
ncbi:hypothetical protein [uncultured Thalassospira sp.]|uniref:hypothetical protein n=1 Tax=uncultured Thalassospira sp. TaxID=404382 RepID=UPI00258ED3BF|nr:hypothetical protein [uncultured Thalassospira sp.]